MKIPLLYKFIFALILIPTLGFSSTAKEFKGKHTREKSITKEFNVNADATLKVMSSYGNINVSTYEGSTISFEIIIKTIGNDLEKVEKKLKDINVEFNASNEMVVAKTIFNKDKSKSWWNWGKKEKINMEINYMIKMPITNSIDLSNDFGSIDLDKIEGRATISCDYGKITTKELMADNNDISFDYTKDCYFEYIKSGKISADYSVYSVGKAKQLEINADFTKSEIEIAEDVDYNCDYGTLKVNNVNNVVGNGDSLTLLLGNVYQNLSLKADYGSIKIDKMAANAGNVEIESDYNGITIGYDPAYSFDFDLDLEQTSLRNSDEFEFTNKQERSSEKYYQGYSGNTNSGNMVRVKAYFGSVTFKKQ